MNTFGVSWGILLKVVIITTVYCARQHMALGILYFIPLMLTTFQSTAMLTLYMKERNLS